MKVAMVRILISHRTSTRSYYVEEAWDSFIPGRISTLSQYLCEELIAYYKGENVTEKMIHQAREWICYSNASPPLPIKSVGRTLIFNCTDGSADSELDVGTFVRHFEYISELYDFDPSITSVDIPFSVIDVMALARIITNHGFPHSTEHTCSMSLARFLRPFSISIFFDLLRTTTDDETKFLTEVISKQMEPEDKAVSAHWSSIVPDERLWPLIEHLLRRNLDTVVTGLLKNRSLALLIYYITNANMKALDMLQLVKYEDAREVNLADSPLLPNLARSLAFITSESDNADQVKASLAILGLTHYSLDNEDVKCPLIDYLRAYISGKNMKRVVGHYFSLLRRQGMNDKKNESILFEIIDKFY